MRASSASYPHVIPQHQLLGIRIQIHLLAPLAGDPRRHRIAVQMVHEPLRGTGKKPPTPKAVRENAVNSAHGLGFLSHTAFLPPSKQVGQHAKQTQQDCRQHPGQSPAWGCWLIHLHAPDDKGQRQHD